MRQACDNDVRMQSFRVVLAAEMMMIMIMVLTQSLDIALPRRIIRAYTTIIRFENLLIKKKTVVLVRGLVESCIAD